MINIWISFAYSKQEKQIIIVTASNISKEDVLIKTKQLLEKELLEKEYDIIAFQIISSFQFATEIDNWLFTLEINYEERKICIKEIRKQLSSLFK